jgi:hypothetical protein
MKTPIRQLAFAAFSLLIIVIVLCSFAPAKRNSVANGSGMAGSISFSFNAVEQKDGVVIGSIQYGERPIQLMVPAGLANLQSFSLMTDMLSLLVIMEKDPLPDWISDPITAEKSPYVSSSDFYGMHLAA